MLWVTGFGADRALAPQVSAPGPWAEFHDLRWLLVLHQSWLTLMLEAAGLLLVRSGLDTEIILAAWPSDDGPARLDLLRRHAAFTLAAWVFLLPWTVLDFGMAVVPISWLFFTAVPPVFVVALVCSSGALDRRWWCRVPPRRAVSTSAAVFAAQTAASLAITAAPAGLWVPVALAAGLANGWAWRRTIRAVVEAGAPRRAVPLAPAVSIGMVVVAVSGAAIAFAVVGARRPPPASGTVASGGPGSGPPILVASGFDSKLDASTPAPPLRGGLVVRFSYRGSDRRGDPEPYTAGDTHRSIADLARLMSVQVSELHDRTGQDVVVVAESEGSLIAEIFAATDPAAPVSRMILLSPLDQPARVYYPAPGEDGFGLATGGALDVMMAALGGISPVHLPPNSPLLRSIVGQAPSLRGLLSCPPTVPVYLLEPLADALAGPVAPPGAMPSAVLPAFHGGLLTNSGAQHDIDRLVAGGDLPPSGLLGPVEAVLRGSAAGWQVPSLPLSLYTTGPDAPSCRDITAGLARWVSLPPGSVRGRRR